MYGRLLLCFPIRLAEVSETCRLYDRNAGYVHYPYNQSYAAFLAGLAVLEGMFFIIMLLYSFDPPTSVETRGIGYA